MRYITGTCFTVKDIRVLRALGQQYANFLAPGTYTILTIRKKEDGVEYSLSDGNKRIVVLFPSVEEADKAIALCRKERYP